MIGHENASQERRRNDEAALDVRGVCFVLVAVFMDRNGSEKMGLSLLWEQMIMNE